MNDNLVQLKNQRRVVKSNITRFKNYFESVKNVELNEEIIMQLSLRLEKIEPSWEQFNELQMKIEVLESENIDEEERERFETTYFSLISDAKASVKKYENQCDVVSENVSVASLNISNAGNNFNNIDSCVRLPPIKLPTFDGKYSSWLEFKDSFTALVDKNEQLSNIQKFLYLRSSLEKEVNQIIKSIEVSADNYQTAWQFLVDRFENKKLIIYNHIRAIFEHPSVTKESFVELRNIYDNILKNLRALKSLGEQTDSWDRLIIYIISNKFDNVTRRDWESYQYRGELPDMADLNSFLKAKCEILEKLEMTKTEKHRGNSHVPFKRHNISNSFATTERNISCFYCKQNHMIYKCDSFLSLSVEDKIAKVKELKLCLNCLRSKHFAWNCKAQKCFKCKKSHNTLLHLETSISNSIENATGVNNSGVDTQAVNHTKPDSSSVICISECAVADTSHVLLSTAIIQVKNSENKYVTCRALLDSGSQSHFISGNMCKQLGLKPTKINHLIKGVGQTLTNIGNKVKISFKSCYSNFAQDVDCLILPKITDKLPMMTFKENYLNIPKGLQLADPTFNVSADIDILLGSAIFWSILCTGQEKLGQNLPVLQNTYLGWVIAGNLSLTSNNLSFSYLSTNYLENSIDKILVKFWELEEVDNNKSILSSEEEYCETYFSDTTTRNKDGRFIVKIPFKNSVKELGSSREIALHRFEILERRLDKNPELKLEYVAFMSEYENLEHMTKIELNNENLLQGYFLPHHAVLKSSSLTTKCRVVFDASAKTSTNVSLNHVQCVGPKLQQDIFCILTRFRKHKIVMTADISKMYRQILISDDQTKYQRIFWRSNPSEKLQCYELKTVTYGTASAPYLAVRCLVQLARENEVEFPVVSKIIRDDFYVDDVLTGADSVKDALDIQKGLSQILSSACFQLRKWLCNDKTLLDNFEIEDNLDVSVLQIAPNEQNKTLGVYWNSNEDSIQFSISSFPLTEKITKRKVLSIICQIFDPLGLLGPIIIVAKLIMQELWKLKLNWDMAIPKDLYAQWVSFLEELPIVNKFKIPRHMLVSEYVTIELHGFSDASERAFGACLYIKCVLSSGYVCSNLVCAKSRVAPLKKVSLPRLELCGALLLANLAKRVIDSLEIKFDKKYFWTDSMITLAWIKAESARWKTFVANRVSEIQTLTNTNDWNHVKSGENPADLLSRGTLPSTLEFNTLWWNGPQFLLSDKSEWNIQECSLESDIPEIRITAMTIQVDNVVNSLLDKWSSVSKLTRILAYIMRFSKNLRLPKGSRVYGALTPDELNGALKILIETVQRECFPKEYACLLKGSNLSNKSKILSLNPFLHGNLIRVGGRIRNSNQSFEKTHPIILPKGNKLTDLILKNEHERLLHAGTQTMLSSIRETYWPISGRNLCKKIIKNCVRCFRVKPTNLNYLMGDLPDIRVNNYLPFHNVGTDFCGPFLLKDRKGRGSKSHKAYICLFVCMSTKAVHLELVSELTTDAFLATLHRFISRRGKPLNIHSDNALNFVGAKNELLRVYSFLNLNHENIANKLAADQINWHFIPARSPNFGGIWEAGIKSTKYHIKRVIGNVALNFEEFNTVLSRVEAILNSRPLCPLTSDPTDSTALTPAHFLIGKTLTALPERDITEVHEGRLTRWQRLQSIIQHYWTRWHKEYLSELQTRTKWRQNSHKVLQEGSLVLVKDDNSAPMNWQLGRITKFYPGQDGIVRVVNVKVRDTVVKRAITRICVLPIEN